MSVKVSTALHWMEKGIKAYMDRRVDEMTRDFPQSI